MSPVPSADNLLNRRLIHAESLGEPYGIKFGLPAMRDIMRADELNIQVRQLGSWTGHSLAVNPPSIDGIPHVVRMRPSSQMFGVEALTVITGVQYQNPGWQRNSQAVSYRISDNVDSTRDLVDMDQPIAVSVKSIWPLNTRITWVGNSIEQKLVAFRRHHSSPPEAHGAWGRGDSSAAAPSIISYDEEY